jgi:hypothetical protein
MNSIAFLTSGNLNSAIAAELLAKTVDKKRTKLVLPELANVTPIFVNWGQDNLREAWIATIKQSVAYGLQLPKMLYSYEKPVLPACLISFLLTETINNGYSKIYINIPRYKIPYPEYTSTFLDKFSKENYCDVRSPLHIFHSEDALNDFVSSTATKARELAYQPKDKTS